MSETGLLIAEIVFLVLLYLFVWGVVRSSLRELRREDPAARPLPLPPPVNDPSDTSRHRAVEAVPAAPVAVAAPTVPASEAVVADAAPAAEPAPSAASERARERERERDSGPIMELAANIRPRLVVDRSPGLEDGAELTLDGGITIGRSESSQLSVPDVFVSHMHARVFRRGQFYYVEDLGSTNGTFVNDRRIDGEARLKVHDALRVGETVLRYVE
jgi:hypothetical protein